MWSADNTGQQLEWYLARDGREYGPITNRELGALQDLGKLRASDLLWREGWSNWVTADRIFSAPVARPPRQRPPALPIEEPDTAKGSSTDQAAVATLSNPGRKRFASLRILLPTVTLLIVVGIVALTSTTLERVRSAATDQEVSTPTLTSRPPSRKEVLQSAALELNKGAPQQISTLTRFDGARVEDDQLVYEYMLTAEKMTADGFSNFSRPVRARAVSAFCEGDLKEFRDLHATVVYRYRYADGEGIGQVVVAEQDCN